MSISDLHMYVHIHASTSMFTHTQEESLFKDITHELRYDDSDSLCSGFP